MFVGWTPSPASASLGWWHQLFEAVVLGDRFLFALRGGLNCIWRLMDSSDGLTIMRILFLLLSLVAAGAAATWFATRALKRVDYRISLRGMLAFIAVVAILLAATLGYRRASMASINWLNTNSNAAKQMFPLASPVENENGNFEFVYYARNRSVQRLLPQINGTGYSVDRETVTAAGDDVETAKTLIQSLRQADKLGAGAFVIRGRVTDSAGKPLDGAHVDILGQFLFINCWKTRVDGTFTAALTDKDAGVPSGAGFYFRIRHPAETKDNPIRWHSPFFSLDPSRPEMVAEIRLP